MTTGSLGQGASLAAGIALGDYIKGVRAKTYLIIGDGESQEGQIWEAAMFTAAKKLTNLIWLIDENKKQLDGDVDEILPIFDLKEKFAAFASRRRFDQIFLSGGICGKLHYNYWFRHWHYCSI